MSDLVRIRVKNSTRYYRKPNHGTTEDKALSHLYERAEAERIVAMTSERAVIEPVAPTPACRCAELAAARRLAMWIAAIEIPEGCGDGTWAAKTIYCNNQITAFQVREAKRIFEALSADPQPAAHGAAKDAEIARLREAIREAHNRIHFMALADFSGLTEDEIAESQSNIQTQTAEWLATAKAALEGGKV